MKKLFKGILALALVLTVVSSVTLLPTNPSNGGGISTYAVPGDWDLWQSY